MGGKQPSHTTTTQKIELPAWVENASQENYQLAKDIGERDYKANPYEKVLGLSGQEQAAGGTLQGGIDMTNTALGGAMGIAGRAAGYNPMMVQGPNGPQNVTAGSFLSGDVGAYMDPELERTVALNEQGQRRGINIQAQGNSDAARGVGAFGGSRHGVTDAVLRSEGENAIALNSANQRGAAFQNASARMAQDQASALQAALANQQAGLSTEQMRLQASTANQNAGLAGAGLNLQAGSLLNQIGQTSSDTAGRNALLQTQLGANERTVAQAQQDQKAAQWAEKNGGYDTEMLNLRLAALGMSPYGKTQTTTAPNPNQSNSLMTGIGAAATMLPLLFSDRKVKKNVKKVGKTDNDLNVYEFEYKKPMGIGGKKIGLMAQDVERKVPSAVKTVNVKGTPVKAVDYGKALNAPRDKRDDEGKPRRPYKPRVRFGIGGHARAA